MRSKELLDQGPPRNVDAEKAVLGCILLDRSLIEKLPLEPQDFHVPAHCLLFEHLQQYPRPGAVDIHLFVDWLSQAGHFEKIGGAAYLGELAQSVASVHNVMYYAEAVKESSERRSILQALLEGVRVVYDQQAGPAEIAEDQRSRLGCIGAAGRFSNRGDLVIRLSDVAPEPIRRLWPGRIALGKLTLLAGDPGLGKSLLTLDVVAHVTRGLAWPDNPESPTPLGGAILLSAEDDVADTIRPRLDAAGADVERVVQLAAIVGRDSDGSYSRAVDLSRDLGKVAAAVESLPNCRPVVIDPLSAYLGKCDDSSNGEIRGLLAPLGELVVRLQVAVLAVTHLCKAGGPAIYRSLGSLAFTAAARAAWAVVADKQDRARRLFPAVKNNLAGDVLGMSFGVAADRDSGIPVLACDPAPIQMSADKALNGESAGEETREATAWLRAALSAGPVGAGRVLADRREAGYSKKVLHRALRQLGGATRKRDFGAG